MIGGVPGHLVLPILQIATESAIVPYGPNNIASLELLPMMIQANSSLIYRPKGQMRAGKVIRRLTRRPCLCMSSGVNGLAPS